MAVNFQKELYALLHPSWDLVVREVKLNGLEVQILYLKGLANEDMITHGVIAPLKKSFQAKGFSFADPEFPLSFTTASTVKTFSDPEETATALLAGWTILVAANSDFAYGVFLPGWARREPKEPEAERVIRGPREGFTEDLLENISMVRRWIKDPGLRVEEKIIGARTKTPVLLVYLENLASPALVGEVRKRLEAIEIDGVLESGYLEELITDERLTIFPLVQPTERPDKVTAALLEGRVAILVDKSPSALLVPVTVNELYQTPDDYYLGFWLGTFLRLIRLLGNNLAVALPGLYVALVGINPELLPTTLLITIASLRQGAPFPLVLEVLFASIAIEIFFEAGLRMPGTVASIGGVVVGVVLGFATIQAGLISSPTLVISIIASITLLSGPNYSVSIAWRILKYLLIFGGAVFGLFGLVLIGVLVFAHLATLQSFGTSYLAPWAPLQPEALGDAFIRQPLWLKKSRFATYRPTGRKRQGNTRKDDDNHA